MEYMRYTLVKPYNSNRGDGEMICLGHHFEQAHPNIINLLPQRLNNR